MGDCALRVDAVAGRTPAVCESPYTLGFLGFEPMYLSFEPAIGSAQSGFLRERAQLTGPVGHSPTCSTVWRTRGGEFGFSASTDRSSDSDDAAGIRPNSAALMRVWWGIFLSLHRESARPAHNSTSLLGDTPRLAPASHRRHQNPLQILRRARRGGGANPSCPRRMKPMAARATQIKPITRRELWP